MASFAVKRFCARNCLGLLKPTALPKILASQRSYTSALYIPGNKASSNFAYLIPEIDFDDRVVDVERLQNELSLRGSTINAEELRKSWEYYQDLHSNLDILEQKHTELTREVKGLYDKKGLSTEEKNKIDATVAQIRDLKKEEKAIKEVIWGLQETVIPQILKVPNEIDPRTPSENPIVIKTVGEKPNVSVDKRQSHLDIGKKLGLLEYRNPIQCYLCDEAALFELGAIAVAGKVLDNSGATRVAGPDFATSLLVEGSGLDHENPMETFILQNPNNVAKDDSINKLHLVGGATLTSLLAMFTKASLKLKDFPIKMFTTGRQYTPFPSTAASSYGLFSVCQASCVQALTLVLSKENDDHKKEFESLVETASMIYDDLGCHYRIVLRSAKELHTTESMRVSFEMWSVHSDQYVEVGHVSTYGDYFSKRLLTAYRILDGIGFPAAITGTILSIPKVLGCLLEENPEKFVLPEKAAGFLH